MDYQIPQYSKPQKTIILQGDWEGGISNVALDMINNGIDVTKVTLNAADWIYQYKKIPSVSFDRPFDQFENWLRAYIVEHQVDCVLIYNQYRPYNEIGWNLAKELDLKCIVLELGILRPDFCTIYSREYDQFDYLKTEWEKLNASGKKLLKPNLPDHLGMMKTMKKMRRFAAFFLFSRIMATFFRKYTHYIDQRGQGFFHHFKALVMSGLRYQGREKHQRFDAIFSNRWSGKFYFVPLQVHCDSQITKRSDYQSIETFIDDVIESFQKHAPKGTKLVFKVHPMDRGYADYHKKILAINKAAAKNRIHYVDRIHLPTALTHCCGAVTINSSVGLSALIHKSKLICLGEAAFDLEDLTFQGSLDDFWASDFRPDPLKVRNFINLLKHTSQANGTFFQKLYSVRGHSKINWPPMFKKIFPKVNF